MSVDIDRIVQENDRLTKEVRELRSRVQAIESSRWWRLNPRVALRRRRTAPEAQRREGQTAFPLDFDEADRELYRRVGAYTMTTPPRIYALARATEYVTARDIPGALVECGVWRGGSMMAVALTLLRLGVTDRELYLFDTFSGMTPPTDEDVRSTGERAADLLGAASRDADVWATASFDEVREALLSIDYPEQRIHFVKGPVEETLPAHAPEQIALLRLDTDWYASTKHELVHLYPRLSSGGVLILDDYGYWQGARRAADEYFADHEIELLLNRIDNTGRIAIKPD